MRGVGGGVESEDSSSLWDWNLTKISHYDSKNLLGQLVGNFPALHFLGNFTMDDLKQEYTNNIYHFYMNRVDFYPALMYWSIAKNTKQLRISCLEKLFFHTYLHAMLHA